MQRARIPPETNPPNPRSVPLFIPAPCTPAIEVCCTFSFYLSQRRAERESSHLHFPLSEGEILDVLASPAITPVLAALVYRQKIRQGPKILAVRNSSCIHRGQKIARTVLYRSMAPTKPLNPSTPQFESP